MDKLMAAAGAEPLDWPHKTECCGASYSITDRTSCCDCRDGILAMARDAGADCIVTACPLCQLNLDMRQGDIEEKHGERFGLPVFYFTQLLGWRSGCRRDDLGLRSLDGRSRRRCFRGRDLCRTAKAARSR